MIFIIMQHIHLLFSKPLFAVFTGAVGTFLTWIGILTPAIGFLTVCIGFAAAIYSIVTKRNEYLRDKKLDK